MTIDHLKTGAEPTAEVLCVRNTLQIMDSIQHNIGLKKEIMYLSISGNKEEENIC
jgi:hypothetical protein